MNELAKENPNSVYGRLAESVHISGYTLERAIWEFEWLLEDDRWKSVGPGYDDIDEFMKTLEFKEFKIAIDQRERIAKRLAELQASQRATARMLGVSKDTIRGDLKRNGELSPPEQEIGIDNQDNMSTDGELSPPESKQDVPGFSGGGQKEVTQQRRSEEKKKEKEEKINEDKEKKKRADELDTASIEPERDIKPGDIIKMGSHILYCGDAYNLDINADAIITDPPYGIDYEPDWKKWDGTASDFKKIVGDNKAFDPTPFMKYKTMLFFGANYFTNNLPVGGWVVWDKRMDEIKDNMIGNPFELAWFISQHTNKKAIIKRILHGGVVNADSKIGNNEKRYHPTQKPIILLQSIIEDITNEDDIIIDPFAGSGSTLLACELSNRSCRAIEIEPEYCSIIVSRWEDATNKKAIWMQE